MGVLMSKKQQVEKVRKCSAVVTVFKEGITNRPPQASRTDTEDHTNPTEGPEISETDQKEEEESDNGRKQTAPVTQQVSSSVNQEAWSRLLDGKGVEPEDLKKTNQLVPPAFIRPKRDINDDQPIKSDLYQREEPTNDEMCDVCEVWTADDLYPCRICTRVFHDGCLREMGYLSKENLQEMRETAQTTTGWSCYYCDNVNLLLTEEEMYSLMETFKQCKIIPESCLGSDGLLYYKHFVFKQLFERELSDEQEEEVLAQYASLDTEKKGHIEWSDFLYHESLGVLKKFRTQNSLVRLLTAKERDRARLVFFGLDQDKDGFITMWETRRVQTSWFQKHTKESQSCSVSISHVGPISESSPASSGSEKSRGKMFHSDKDQNSRQVGWQEFLRESGIYILAARPNSPSLHLLPPA
ncbi:PHD finger protein 24 isoform X1 [Paramormyrops kingsleyae]|uniref:PHD finger protein 24 isoform X1 n=1 Tax=Paramormyrops kingsleyae TaxID=1676925 RepID=UPI003B974ABD